MIDQPTLSSAVQAGPEPPPGWVRRMWNSGGNACDELA